jgi:CRP/FNR family transcriptional regulator, cyclic AMP receptor protein
VDAKTRALSMVPLFAACGSGELDAIARLADEIDIPAGEELTHEGRSGREFFVILDGSVRVEREGNVIRTLGPGEFFGEIALIDGGPRTATVTTETPVRALVLAHHDFRTLINDNPAVARTVLLALAARVRDHEAGPTLGGLAS